MTYFGVLALFILPPIAVLMVVVPRDLWRRLIHGRGKVHKEPYLVLLAHVVIALVYTTPWDNYLVATGVWWYAQNLVNGIVIGYVPIEEYTFFILQTLMTGLWVITLWRISELQPEEKSGSRKSMRQIKILLENQTIQQLTERVPEFSQPDLSPLLPSAFSLSALQFYPHPQQQKAVDRT